VPYPAHIYHGWPETCASQLKALFASPIEYYERFVAKTASPKYGDSLSDGTLLHSWAEVSDEEFWDRVVDPHFGKPVQLFIDERDRRVGQRQAGPNQVCEMGELRRSPRKVVVHGYIQCE
jgi:hypothetical protein